MKFIVVFCVMFLQDPQAAIPKGTLWAILITGIAYLAVALSVCTYYIKLDLFLTYSHFKKRIWKPNRYHIQCLVLHTIHSIHISQ